MTGGSIPRAVFLFLTGLLSGCSDAIRPEPGPTPPSALFVLNGLGDTLDRIDLETGRVDQLVATLGDEPNALALSDDHRSLFVANSGTNDVWRLEVDSLKHTGTYPLGVNRNPYDVAWMGGGRLAVSNWLSGDVAIIDTETGSVARRVSVGQTPQALLHWNGRLFVTLVAYYDSPASHFDSGEIVEIPVNPAAPLVRAAAGTNPQDVIVGPDGNLHVIATGNYGDVAGEVRVLDPATLALLAAIPLGGSPARAAAAGDHVYVAGYYGGLMKYHGLTYQVLRGVADPVLDVAGLGELALDEERNRLYAAGFEDDQVYVIDTTADTLLTAWDVGDGPLAVALVRR